jgi:nucleoside-diphosphate-sugar epimerase
MPAIVEIVKADASDHWQTRVAATGAKVIYQALNPPYHLWTKLFQKLQANVMSAAQTAEAVYVSIENLYMYDSSSPISENSLIAPRSKKGNLRQLMAEEVIEAHIRGEIKATALRSSDYYGPGVLESAFGERVFDNVVAGKKAQILGSEREPHSFAYIEDVGRAAAALGTQDEALGQVWIAPHAPAKTQDEMVRLAFQIMGTEPKISVLPAFMLSFAGLLLPGARESVEMMYEFTAPFTVESARFESEFGISATPIETGIKRTVAWYRDRRTPSVNVS